jgi:hypothetical protein
MTCLKELRMALSVGEMAELIRRDDMDRAAVVERLRTWTDTGLLEPADRGVGTSHARQYADATVYHAGILNALADFGMPMKASYSGYLAMVRHHAEVARAAWEAEGRRGPMLYLEISDFGQIDVHGRSVPASGQQEGPPWRTDPSARRERSCDQPVAAL